MCELFAMSGSEPANVTFSLGVFGERGGRLGPHRDGWGLAFAAGHDFRIVKEAEPAASSACMRFVESNEIRSTIVLSHLRLATGRRIVSYQNTHPFARELYGRTHVFAHNGDVAGVFDDPRFAPHWHFPLGETDSERAFCALVDRLRAALAPGTVQDLAAKLPVVREWAGEFARHGTANFLLSDGEHLFVHRSNAPVLRRAQLPRDERGARQRFAAGVADDLGGRDAAGGAGGDPAAHARRDVGRASGGRGRRLPRRSTPCGLSGRRRLPAYARWRRACRSIITPAAVGSAASAR